MGEKFEKLKPDLETGDASGIEEATAFYALKNTNSGWKMYAISDITFPA